MSKVESEVFELEDRDPENLNKQIEVNWENLIAEPSLIRSPECAWILSQYCFKYSRFGCYTCLALFCAPFASCIVGFCYAIFYFLYIWCTVPSLWFCKTSCAVTRLFVRAFVNGCLEPIMGGFGTILSHIRITRTAHKDDYHTNEDSDKVFPV